METNLPEIVAALKDACCKAEWWKFVQDEVQTALLFLMDNVAVLGKSFRDSFIENFKYAHAYRVITGQHKPFSEPTVLFSTKFPEEFYRSGIEPTKHCLRLNDWVEPNEADVHACTILCQQIDAILCMDILQDRTPLSAALVGELLSVSTLQSDNRVEEKP